MPTMIVLANLKEDVRPEDYERWVRETYSPTIMKLESVDDWRGYRIGNLLESDSAPPYQYVVEVEIKDLAQLGEDMSGEEVQRLLAELQGFVEPPVQLMTERFV